METPTGLSGLISALTSNITANSLFEVFTQIAPYLAVIIPVALAFYFIRKLVKGTAKAKVRM